MNYNYVDSDSSNPSLYSHSSMNNGISAVSSDSSNNQTTTVSHNPSPLVMRPYYGEDDSNASQSAGQYDQVAQPVMPQPLATPLPAPMMQPVTNVAQIAPQPNQYASPETVNGQAANGQAVNGQAVNGQTAPINQYASPYQTPVPGQVPAQQQQQPHHHHHHQQQQPPMPAQVQTQVQLPPQSQSQTRQPMGEQIQKDVQQQQQRQQQQQQQQQDVMMPNIPVPEPDTKYVTRGKYSSSDFEIQRTSGTGSFGRVHLVRSVHNNRFYAMKASRKAQIVRMKQIDHINDERRILKRVNFPFFIRLWGTFQDSQNLFMIMEYIEGGESFSSSRKSRRFPSPVAKFYASEVSLALEYSHNQDISYRDSKPENISLDKNGHVKIADFGFSKEVPDVTWTLCGTPDYIAPEVVASKPYNKSVDWWSLGVSIFEMLTGYTPFYSQTHMKTYEKIVRCDIQYPSYLSPTVVDLSQRLITKNLSQRSGNSRGGAADIKAHPWFAEVVWEKSSTRSIETPYEPPIQPGVGDTSQFETYQEEVINYGIQGDDPYAPYFVDF